MAKLASEVYSCILGQSSDEYAIDTKTLLGQRRDCKLAMLTGDVLLKKRKGLRTMVETATQEGMQRET